MGCGYESKWFAWVTEQPEVSVSQTAPNIWRVDDKSPLIHPDSQSFSNMTPSISGRRQADTVLISAHVVTNTSCYKISKLTHKPHCANLKK